MTTVPRTPPPVPAPAVRGERSLPEPVAALLARWQAEDGDWRQSSVYDVDSGRLVGFARVCQKGETG